MDPSQLGELVTEHKWVGVAAIVIGVVVRLMKSDTKIPINIPTQYRVWLALGLGIVSGVLEAVATGKAWTPAIVDGLVSAAIAIVGQNAIIDSLRGGKEITVPGLMVPGASPAPGKPPSIDPPAMTP